jgi:cellulose synthase/poly-beta-1,6-N-acetylglucosamine synthase-like glycosyltransferase
VPVLGPANPMVLAGSNSNVPKDKGMKITVVIPVYNETSTIEELIGLVQAVKLDKEIIIVDDCSTDEKLARFRDSPGIQNHFSE